MNQHLTRKNHYVPIWYQRRFLPEGQTKLHYLDIGPSKRELPDGQIGSDHPHMFERGGMPQPERVGRPEVEKHQRGSYRFGPVLL